MLKIITLLILYTTASCTAIAELNHPDKGKYEMGHKEIGHWAAPEDTANIKNPRIGEPASVKRGEALFETNCSDCHGANGRGDGPMGKSLHPKPSDLVRSSGMHSDGEIAWKISNGRRAMPAWKNILSAEEIWDIVNFIKYISEGYD